MSTILQREVEKELEGLDPEDIVTLLGITTNDLIKAFPGHVYDYARQVDIQFDENGEEIERFGLFDEDSEA